MKTIVGLAASLVLVATSASAQGVVTPNTQPSQQEIGGKDAKPASSAPGAATVQGRDFSNGVAAGQPDPAAAPPKQGK